MSRIYVIFVYEKRNFRTLSVIFKIIAVSKSAVFMTQITATPVNKGFSNY